MAKFFHIGFMFPRVPKAKELEAPFSVAGDWIRYSSHCWVVWTERSPQEVFNILKPYLLNDEQFLIVEINMNERNGWLPEWMWKWMNDRQLLQSNALTAGFGSLGNALNPPLPGVSSPLSPYWNNPFDPNKR